jgi:hypothetical protein
VRERDRLRDVGVGKNIILKRILNSVSVSLLVNTGMTPQDPQKPGNLGTEPLVATQERLYSVEFSPHIIRGDQVKQGEMSGVCSTHGRDEERV